jgi:hypothetical protein
MSRLHARERTTRQADSLTHVKHVRVPEPYLDLPFRFAASKW